VFDWSGLGKTMMAAGIILTLIGFLLAYGGKWLPLGRLPGDFVWQRGNFTLMFPLASGLVLSIILTILFNLFLRR